MTTHMIFDLVVSGWLPGTDGSVAITLPLVCQSVTKRFSITGLQLITSMEKRPGVSRIAGNSTWSASVP